MEGVRASGENSQEILKAKRVGTRNRTGWTSNVLNEVAEMFVEACGPGVSALEIGAAYGVATLPALARGAKVLANDLDPVHLDRLWNECPPANRERLTLLAARFPRNVKLPGEAFDLALASNVFHFFTGRQMETGAESLRYWLRPGGRVFVQAATPYMAPFQDFLPEYERRREDGIYFPGWIENTREYSRHGRLGEIPKSIHLLDEEVLARVFTAAGFEIERCWLYRRRDFPPTLYLDGRESVGLVAIKK